MDTAEYDRLREQHDSLLARYNKLCRSFTDQGNLLQRKRIEIARLEGGRNSLSTSSAAGYLPLVRGPLPPTLSSGALPPLHPAVDYQPSSPLSNTLHSPLPSDPPPSDPPLDLSIDFAATGTAQPQESLSDDCSLASSPCPVPYPPSAPTSDPDPESQIVDLKSRLLQRS
ncbi:hypothetical protein A4X13_0g7546, partial [Tilletia indica]